MIKFKESMNYEKKSFRGILVFALFWRKSQKKDEVVFIFLLIYYLFIYCLKCWPLAAIQALHLIWTICVTAKHWSIWCIAASVSQLFSWVDWRRINLLQDPPTQRNPVVSDQVIRVVKILLLHVHCCEKCLSSQAQVVLP